MENKFYSICGDFKNNLRTNIFLIFFGLCLANSEAAVITSTTSGGLWSSNATWVGNALPTTSDDVVIVNNSIVTVDIVSSVKSLTVGQGSSGILQWSSSNAINVSGNVLVDAGASLLLYSSATSGAPLNVGGNFTNNGFSNLSLGTLNFNGSQQSGGSLNQNLNGTGTFAGQGSSGIIRTLTFQTTGSSTISTSQNLIVTLSFIHSAGSLNTNGKLSIDNTAQIYGQAINTQVANIAVTNMGSLYSSSPVVSASGATSWLASTPVVEGNKLVSGSNVYSVTTAGNTGLSAPIHTSGAVTDGATLLWVGNTGTIGNALIKTVVAATQYFYGGNLYTCTVGGAIAVGSPPVHLSGVVASGAASFLYVGAPAQVSVNYDPTSQTLRSLALTNKGSGLSIVPSLSILASAGSGAAATVIFMPKIDGPANATTQKNAIAAITGGININSNQGASLYSGVGAISTASGGFNYTVAPTVGFAGPTAINLVTAGGSGFTSNPTITVSGGTLVSGVALTTSNFLITVAGGKVVSVYLNLATSACYSVPPTLTFAGGGGAGATLAFPAGCWPTATADLGINRQVSNFTITNSGFGYVVAPIVDVGNTGTFGTVAFSLACRVSIYNLSYVFLVPAASNTTFNEGAEVPLSRRMNSFTMNSIYGATFTGNLELIGASPLTLTNGKADFGSNTLTLSNASYLGIAGSTTSSISGIIKLSSLGGSLTKTFPFERTVVVTTGTGSLASGSTITLLTISRTAAPSGSVTPNTNFPTGTRSYRLQTNSGAVYGTSPTIQLNYGAEDGLLTDNPGLLIAKSLATSGPWTVVSTSSGAGTLTVPGNRTTSSFTGTGDDYLAFTTTLTPCNSTPAPGSIPGELGFCTDSNSVTIPLTGYSSTSSGLTFAWEQSSDNINFIPAIGTGTSSTVFTSKVISSTIYYRCKVTCSFGGVAANSNSCKAGPVNCQYNVTRTTGVAYNSIITPAATGSTYSAWTATVPGNDEFTNAVSLEGTTFLYQGSSVNAFYASTNGFLSFNTSLVNSAPINNLISGTLTSKVVAPFWDDLTLRGTLSSNRDNCMRYKINGTLGSGTAEIIIEWADLERSAFGVPNLNFQVILREAGNTIDFNYGNFQLYDGSTNPPAPFSYSIGLNGTPPGTGATISDQMILQRANQNFFSATNQNSLALTPECFSRLRFVPGTYTGIDPGAPGIPANDEKINATTVIVNASPCTSLCGNLYTSALATASAGISACSAVTPGTPDDDVWFKFVTTSQSQYKIYVTPSSNYDAVVQLLDANSVPIQCVNANGIGLSESIAAVGLSPIGTIFFIRIYEAGSGISASNGEFALCVSQFLALPSNDECAGATSLTVGSVCTPTASVLPSTLAATASASIPVCSAASPGLADDDVWYTFTTSANAGFTYNISVTGFSTYNPVLQLFSGTCGALSSINCVNATGNGGTETISSASLTTNTVYRIRVYHAGSAAASGNFTVCVNVTPPPCASSLLPVNGTSVLPASGAVLSWASVAVATSYNVYLSTVQADVTNEAPAALISNQVGLSFNTGAKPGGFIYYWKIVPLVGTFKAANCSVNDFNTNPPTCVTITNPLNSTSVCFKTAFNLTWSASFGATGYDVYLNAGAAPATTLVSANQAGTSFTIAFNSLPPGIHTWRVEPKNAIGTNTTCPNNSFTIISPPIVALSTLPVIPTICIGQSITLTASGATTYVWSPATDLNFTTGNVVIATPLTSLTYTVSGENVSGCASTASQFITVNPLPTSPTVTNYSICTGGIIPDGQGLAASCVSSSFANTISVPLINPNTNEGAGCPGSNTLGSFTFPALPVGAAIISARFTINGITLLGTSSGNEIRLNFSGSGITGGVVCFQGAASGTAPNPVNWVTGVPNLVDSATLGALMNPLGGTITVKYNETVSQIVGPDATFPSTGSFTYTYILSSSVKWYDAPLNGNLIGSGSPFNPIPVPLANSNTPGTYPFYARCESSLCPSLSTTANLIIGLPLAVSATQAAAGSICGGVANQLNTQVSGGSPAYSYSWSPTTGLSNASIANPVATAFATTTYTVTVTDGCSSISTSSITVLITPAPNVTVSPITSSRCVSGAGGIALTGSGATTYTWSPSFGLNTSIGTTVLASPGSSTTYTVTGTNSVTLCKATATATVTVGSTLSVTATASPNALCPGGSSQLNTSVLLNGPYCVTSNISGSPCITSVVFNTLNNPNSICSSPNFETYPFNGNTTTQVLQGNSYSLTVNTSADAIVSVWIDYNRNEVYEASEWNQVYTNGTTGNILIQIPANAITGVTGMRVRSRGAGGVNGATEACTIFGTGVSQNYVITIGNPPSNISYSWSPSTFLNSNVSANPLASGVTGASNTYTVIATNLSGGCTATSSVTLTITPFTAAAINSIPSNPVICSGTTQILSSTVTGGSPPYTYSWAPATGLNVTTGSSVIASPATTTNYTLTIKDNCNTTIITSPLTLTVLPSPVTTVSGIPSSLSICTSGSINLTANGATSYSWSPASGLNNTNSQVVSASPIFTTSYTVTGTTNNCSSTATITVNYSTPVQVNPTANVNPGCSPLTTQLNANVFNPTGTAANYIFSASGGGTLDPMIGASQIIGSNEDNNPTSELPLGFNFIYEGVSYSSYSASPDGWIKLGGGIAQFENVNLVTSPINLPKIYSYWDDLNTGVNGNVKTLISGSAPNRIFIAQWFVVLPRNLGGAAQTTIQTWLYESGGKIEFRYGAMGTPTGSLNSIGITGLNSNNFNSVTISSNASSNLVANDANPGKPLNGTIYTFIPLSASQTYLWTPATNLNSTTLANPTVLGLVAPSTTYTVTATNSNGCSGSGTLTVTVNPSPSPTAITYPGSPNTAALTFCQGGSVLLNGTGPYTSYSWSDGTNVLATTPTYNATTSGTYTVTGFIANGCSASSSVVVNVLFATTPIVTYPGFPSLSPLTFCQGKSVVFSTTIPYTSYIWSSGGPTLGTASTYPATATGEYRVIATAANGCTASSTTVSVSVIPGPNPPVITPSGTTLLCNDVAESVILNSSDISGLDALWNDIGESTTPSITVFGNDVNFQFFGSPYSFCLTVSDPATGCFATSNCVTVTQLNCGGGITFNSKVILGGYYSSGGLMQIGGSGFLNVTGISADPLDVDSVSIYAMSAASPHIEVDHQKGVLKTNGDINVVFGPAVLAGSSYYIKVSHHNSIETWSALPVLFTSPITSYLFTTNSSQAFGDNMVKTHDNMGWAIFTGDLIPQDGVIDAIDFLFLDPSIQNGDGGYVPQDLNGDGAVDAIDFLVLDINIQGGVGTATPP